MAHQLRTSHLTTSGLRGQSFFLSEAKVESCTLLCTGGDIAVTTFVSEVEEVDQLGNVVSRSQYKSNTSATTIEPLFERQLC